VVFGGVLEGWWREWVGWWVREEVGVLMGEGWWLRGWVWGKVWKWWDKSNSLNDMRYIS